MENNIMTWRFLDLFFSLISLVLSFTLGLSGQ